MRWQPETRPEAESVSGRTAALDARIALVILLVVLQLWLLTVALDTFLVGDVPGTLGLAATSGLAFVAALTTLLFYRRHSP